MKNRIINTIVIGLIILIPLLTNILYVFAYKYLPTPNEELDDNFTYNVSIIYQYPNIPTKELINISSIKGAPKLEGINEVIEFSDLKLDDIPLEARASIIATKSYIINFRLGSCRISDGSLLRAIQAGESEQKRNILFPSYVKNFYKIQITKHTDNYVRTFVEKNCNLPKEYPYQIKFSNLLNYNGPYTY